MSRRLLRTALRPHPGGNTRAALSGGTGKEAPAFLRGGMHRTALKYEQERSTVTSIGTERQLLLATLIALLQCESYRQDARSRLKSDKAAGERVQDV